MKIGLYSPFLAENIGGGERYLLTVAECLLKNHQVDLVIQPDKVKSLKNLKSKLIKNFNLKLNNLKLIVGPFSKQHSSKDRKKFTHHYDIFYYMTDGSFFISKAKLNLLHFMIPFNQRPGFFQRFKLKSWDKITANSFFTKNHLEKVWKIKVDHVHGGVVSPKDFHPGHKKNLILNVGRFFSSTGNKHCKKQDFLVKTFKTMCQNGLKNWQLVLNGPIDIGKDNQKYFQKVKSMAKGLPIIINAKVDFKTLQQNYAQAKIYWHATGFDLNEEQNPQAVEHLGISTIEAMSAGAVPVVIKKGGQPEIVTHGVNGLLWDNPQQLIKQTQALINDPQLLKKLSQQAQKRAEDFSKNKFCQQTNKIFNL